MFLSGKLTDVQMVSTDYVEGKFTFISTKREEEAKPEEDSKEK